MDKPVNPHSKTHGAPSDEERHVGDMGNFKTDGQGNAKGTMTDKLIKLIGPESILGVSSLLPSPLTFPSLIYPLSLSLPLTTFLIFFFRSSIR